MCVIEAILLWYWLSGVGVTIYVLLLDIEEGSHPELSEWPLYLCAFAIMPIIWPGVVFFVLSF